MLNYAPTMMSQSIPFSLPGATVATTAKSGFSLSSIFSGIQKTATTINQIVPLYHNVKPLISNSKAIFSIMKGVASSPNKERQINTPTVEKEPIDVKLEEKESTIEIKSTNTPSKPFFA